MKKIMINFSNIKFYVTNQCAIKMCKALKYNSLKNLMLIFELKTTNAQMVHYQ